MAITLVQKASSYTSATTAPPALNFPSAVTAGNGLIYLVGTNDNQTVSISDTLGNTVQSAVALGGSGNFVAVYYVQNTLGGANGLNVSWSASANAYLAVAEYSGLATSGMFDSAATIATGTSTTPTTNSATPTVSGELAIAFFSIGLVNLSGTWSNGFTARDTISGHGMNAAWADQVLSGTTSTSTTFSSANNGSQWSAALALFKPPGSPPPTTGSYFLENQLWF